MPYITSGVGKGQPNNRRDVEAVQTLLNQNVRPNGKPSPFDQLVITRSFDAMTERALIRFQSQVMKVPATGIVLPGDETYRALYIGAMFPTSGFFSPSMLNNSAQARQAMAANTIPFFSPAMVVQKTLIHQEIISIARGYLG